MPSHTSPKLLWRCRHVTLPWCAKADANSPPATLCNIPLNTPGVNLKHRQLLLSRCTESAECIKENYQCFAQFNILWFCIYCCEPHFCQQLSFHTTGYDISSFSGCFCALPSSSGQFCSVWSLCSMSPTPSHQPMWMLPSCFASGGTAKAKTRNMQRLSGNTIVRNQW